MPHAANKDEELLDDRWSARKIRQLAFLAAVVVLGLFSLFVYTQNRSIAAETETRLQYFARSLEQISSSLLDSASSDLDALSLTLDLLGARSGETGTRSILPLLAAWTGDRPWIRSVVVLSTSGQVMYSSIASDVGHTVDLRLLGPLPLPEQNTQQGPVLMGRGITELRALDVTSNTTGSPLLALVRNTADATAGSSVYMVALVNLDYFSNSFDLLLDRSGIQAAMLNYSAVAMAGTADIGTTPRRLTVQTPIFRDFLPKHEQGSYRGSAVLGGDAADTAPAQIAFRAMRNWPTIIVVQRSTSLLTRQLMDQLWPVLGASCSIVLLVAALMQVALRSQQRRAQLREELGKRAAEADAAVVRDTAIQKSSLDAIIIIDEYDRMLSFNPAAETIFGHRAADVLGRTMADLLVPPGLREAHRQGLKRFVHTGKTSILNSRRETLGQRADGSFFPMEIGIVAIAAPNGLHFIGTIRDITVLKDEQAKSIDLMFELDLAAKELVSKNRVLEQSNQRELQIAQHIQSSILVSPPGHLDPRLWISAFNQASKGVDGDFFEILTVGENCFDLIAGDVMGKGIPAALLGAGTKLQFSRSLVALLIQRENLNAIPQPREIITHVSQSIAPNLQSLNAFVTLVYIRIDLTHDTLTWVGCGHEESLLVKGSGAIHSLSNQQPPLGVLLNEVFEQSEMPFHAGDALFLSSDGASDALDMQGRHIGRDLVNETVRLLLQMHQTPSMTLHSLRRNLLTQNVTLQDDLTLAILTRPLRPNAARLEVPVSLESLRKVRLFVEELTQRSGLEVARSDLFVVAAAEVLTNAIRHAKGLLPEAPIEVVGEFGMDKLLVEFKYIGDYFEPPADLPDTNFGDFPTGGFGLHIIRQATDRVDYLHDSGVNTIRMSINLNDHPA